MPCYAVLCAVTSSFLQVMKIAVAPTVMVLDLLLFRTIPPIRVVLSVFIVCIGIGIATVTGACVAVLACWQSNWQLRQLGKQATADSVWWYASRKGMLLPILSTPFATPLCRCHQPPPQTAFACVTATVTTDDKIISNFFGLAVGMAATLVTALYQIWAGTLQTQLKASSTQLLHQYTPQAALLLGLLIPIMEPVGRPGSSDPGTLLGYK